MESHSDVEGILTAVLHQVLVGADTTGLERLRRQLLVLIRNQVHAQREILNASLLAAQIKDADLRVGNTSTETRLRVGLVLAVPITRIKTTRSVKTNHNTNAKSPST